MSSDWRARCDARKQKQLDSIPSAWLIEPIANNRFNVMDVPRECGMLTPQEMEITETTDVEFVLHMLKSAEWSSVEVTTAFYKRAVIAQQLVCIIW
jgi:amidase